MAGQEGTAFRARNPTGMEKTENILVGFAFRGLTGNCSQIRFRGQVDGQILGYQEQKAEIWK